jgi:hypothetical protein
MPTYEELEKHVFAKGKFLLGSRLVEVRFAYHPQTKFIYELGGVAWSYYLHLEFNSVDEAYKKLEEDDALDGLERVEPDTEKAQFLELLKTANKQDILEIARIKRDSELEYLAQIEAVSVVVLRNLVKRLYS